MSSKQLRFTLEIKSNTNEFVFCLTSIGFKYVFFFFSTTLLLRPGDPTSCLSGEQNSFYLLHILLVTDRHMQLPGMKTDLASIV